MLLFAIFWILSYGWNVSITREHPTICSDASLVFHIYLLNLNFDLQKKKHDIFDSVVRQIKIFVYLTKYLSFHENPALILHINLPNGCSEFTNKIFVYV